jgi:hypothetical protein
MLARTEARKRGLKKSARSRVGRRAGGAAAPPVSPEVASVGMRAPEFEPAPAHRRGQVSIRSPMHPSRPAKAHTERAGIRRPNSTTSR